VFAPERPDGINQKVDGDRGRCDGERECCVELCDVRLEDGYGTSNEEGIDGGDLVIECIFHPPWGVEYEDSWWRLMLMAQGIPSLIHAGLTQTKCCNVIWWIGTGFRKTNERF